MIPRELAFESSEYERRLANIRRGMTSVGLDALILTNAASVYYLCGLDTENWTDPQFLVVMSNGAPLLVASYFERGRVANSCWTERVIYYHSRSEAVVTAAAAVTDLGLNAGALGIEQRSWGLTPLEFNALVAGLPRAEIRDPYGIVEESRLLKSPAEIALMRRAAEMTAKGTAAGRSAMVVGGSDSDVGAAIVAALYHAGSDLVCWGPAVAVGYRAGSPHCTFNGSRLKLGDTVFLEFTGQAHRYAAPVMWTAVVGQPTDDMERIADAGRRAIEAAIKAARPGVLAAAVARIVHDVLEPVVDRYSLFTPDRYGYPVGIGFPPTWDENSGFLIRADNERPLRSGMTFHLPISLRRYGEYGINQSSTIVITETGAEALTSPPDQLPVVS